MEDTGRGLRISDLENVKEIKKIHGPGIIGTASATMSRYVEYNQCLWRVQKPDNTGVMWETSIGIAENFNRMCEQIMQNTQYEFLWILGDDHVFKPNLLMNLLDRELDIVVPLCLRRHPPYWPVINGKPEDKHPALDWDAIEGKSGLIEVDACGNAGMLIRRHVIEKLARDWHRAGCLKSGAGGPDLWFCMRARKEGFKIYIDTDNPIGHMTHMAVWPVKDDNGVWRVEIRPALDMPG